MNLSLVSTIFVVGLLLQTPNIINALNRKSERDAKHIVDGAKLIVALKSDRILLRSPRGSDNPVEIQKDTQSTVDEATSPKNNGVERRPSKIGGHNNKKLNRNQESNTPINRRKSHTGKSILSSEDQQSHQHSVKRQHFATRQQQQHDNSKGNKERQLIKSHQHQGQSGGKRNGQKSNTETVNHEINGSKTPSTCRYTKSNWSDCDPKTNTHSRTLILKKGDNRCLQTRTIEKRCKRVCRYEKGAWTACKDGQMVRVDKLKTSTTISNPTVTSELMCEPARTRSKKCNPDESNDKPLKSNANRKGNKKERKSKEKVSGSQPT